jgi:hypothetical protein
MKLLAPILTLIVLFLMESTECHQVSFMNELQSMPNVNYEPNSKHLKINLTRKKSKRVTLRNAEPIQVKPQIGGEN